MERMLRLTYNIDVSYHEIGVGASLFCVSKTKEHSELDK